MNNERTEPVEDQHRTDSRLAEYQVCQQFVGHHGAAYWNMTGIFIAFSSVLLSAIVFGLISNEKLFNELIHVEFFAASKQVVVFRVLVTIIGLIILGIYFVLWRWLQRVRYLQQTNYRRMREIEIKSGMHIGLLITGIDDWNELEPDEQQALEVLKKGKEWCIEQRKNMKLYASPTSKWNHKAIFVLLALLWVIMIPSVWLLYLRYYKYILIVLIVLYVAFIYWPEIKDWFQHTKQKTTQSK